MVGVVVKQVPNAPYVQCGAPIGGEYLLSCKPSLYHTNQGIVRFAEISAEVAVMKCPLNTFDTLDQDGYWIGDRMCQHVEEEDVKAAWSNLFDEGMPDIAASFGTGGKVLPEVGHNLRGVLCSANLLSTMSRTFSFRLPSTNVPTLLGHLTARIRKFLGYPDFCFVPNSVESGLLLARIYTRVLSGRLSVPQVDGQGRLLAAVLSMYRLPPEIDVGMALAMTGSSVAAGWRPLPPPDWVMLGQSFDIDFMVLPKREKEELLAAHDVKVCKHISIKIQAGQTASASTSWGDITRALLGHVHTNMDENQWEKIFPIKTDYVGTLWWLSEYLVSNFGNSPMVMEALKASRLDSIKEIQEMFRERKRSEQDDEGRAKWWAKYSTGLRTYPNMKDHDRYLELLDLCVFCCHVLIFDPVTKSLCNLELLRDICQTQGIVKATTGGSTAMTGLHDRWDWLPGDDEDDDVEEDDWRHSQKRNYFIVRIPGMLK